MVAFVSLLGCSRSTPDPVSGEDTRAILNGQAWSGFATVWKNSSDSCGRNTVNLTIQNKLDYPRARLHTLANCIGYCGDQSLVFARIPVATGVYRLSTLQPCSVSPNQVSVSFTTLIGGDVLRDQYQPDVTRTSTLTITRYDPQAGAVEGTFDLVLVRDKRRQTTTDAADTLTFQNGTFTSKLP